MEERRQFYGYFRSSDVGFKDKANPLTFTNAACLIVNEAITLTECVKTSALDTDALLLTIQSFGFHDELNNLSNYRELFNKLKTSVGFDNIPKTNFDSDTWFTYGATRSLVRSYLISQSENKAKIDTKDLLIGVLLEDEGKAAKVLKELNIDRKNLVRTSFVDRYISINERFHIGRSY